MRQKDTERGARFRALREGARLTQKQVADALGIQCVSVSHWEVGYNMPATAKLTSLAKLYGVTVIELLAPGDDARRG